MKTSFVLYITALCLAAASRAPAEPFHGPFALSDGMTFYIVNGEGKPFSLTLTRPMPGAEGNPVPLLVRVFDPEERRLVRRTLVEHGSGKGDETLHLSIPARGKGVYQVVVNGFGRSIDLATEPALPFGVFGHLQWLCGRGDQFADAHVYLPPGLAKWTLACSGKMKRIALTDDAGRERLSLSGDSPKGEVELPASGGHVWRLSAVGQGDYRLDFGGPPIILCPGADTARAIRASVDVLPDGTICFHKFQVRAHALLERYRALPRSAYAVPLPDLEAHEQAWLAEPARNLLLLRHYGVYSILPAVLAEQNLDPASPSFGSIRAGGGRENPWASYDRPGSVARLVKVMAAVHELDRPFNPLHKNPALLNRVIVGSLQNLMCIKEGEFAADSNTYYYGHHAFNLAHEQTGAFPCVVRDCPADVQAVWTDGLGRLVDRFCISQVGGCTNQWTFILLGLTHFWRGTGDDVYRDALRTHVRWIASAALWSTGQKPAGYMTESGGPDATYNGISGHNLGYVYHELKDPVLLESLRKCFDLFDHTIAPEPDGSWTGASSYCHRTPGDWTSPQYGAGYCMLGDDLPSAGLRAGRAWVYEDAKGAEERLRKALHYFPPDHFDRDKANAGRASGAYDIHYLAWKHFASKPLPGKLPVVAMDRFTRNFGDEFFCVRRPAYYAFLYVGRPRGEWQRPRVP